MGRSDLVERILRRGAGQVSAGKPVTMFIQGEYGIGKSSLINYTQKLAEREHKLLPIYVTLGGCKTLEDVAVRVVECTLTATGQDTAIGDKVRNFLARYVGEQQLFGFKINLQNLKADAPSFSSPQGMLGFLDEIFQRVHGEGVAGLFVVLDEINGIASDPAFAQFLKSFVDENGVKAKPLPLLLALCGTEDKRREMISRHQPVDRVFDVIQVEKMTDVEMNLFFDSAFRSCDMIVHPASAPLLLHFSAGLPKIMQMLGDSAYWIDRDSIVDPEDVFSAANATAEDVGRKFVDQQVFKELRSDRYQSILDVIGADDPFSTTFVRSEIIQSLNPDQQKAFDNFLRRMRDLNVIRQGDRPGEYVFNVLMVRYYIYLTAQRRAV